MFKKIMATLTYWRRMRNPSWRGRPYDKYWGPFLFSPREKSKRKEKSTFLFFQIKLSFYISQENGDYRSILNLAVMDYYFAILLPVIKRLTPVSDDELKREYSITVYREDVVFCFGVHDTMSSSYPSKDSHFYKRVNFTPWTRWRCIEGKYFDVAPGFPLNMRVKGETWYHKKSKEDPSDLIGVFMGQDLHDDEWLLFTVGAKQKILKRGEGRWKWISLFTKPQYDSFLELNFENELGSEKGSWKGGTCGLSLSFDPEDFSEVRDEENFGYRLSRVIEKGLFQRNSLRTGMLRRTTYLGTIPLKGGEHLYGEGFTNQRGEFVDKVISVIEKILTHPDNHHLPIPDSSDPDEKFISRFLRYRSLEQLTEIDKAFKNIRARHHKRLKRMDENKGQNDTAVSGE